MLLADNAVIGIGIVEGFNDAGFAVAVDLADQIIRGLFFNSNSVEPIDGPHHNVGGFASGAKRDSGHGFHVSGILQLRCAPASGTHLK